jgi:hypothetical protein
MRAFGSREYRLAHDTYSHVLPTMQYEATAHIERMLTGDLPRLFGAHTIGTQNKKEQLVTPLFKSLITLVHPA